jgi:hypothetical protein
MWHQNEVPHVQIYKIIYWTVETYLDFLILKIYVSITLKHGQILAT